MKTKDFSGIRTQQKLPHPTEVDVPADAMDLMRDYIDSTSSLLEELEAMALKYESGIDKNESSAVIKRILHKLKGEASIMGLDDISELCHQTEFAFEEMPDTKKADMLLRMKDWLRSAIEYFSVKI